jgi:ATP adenylyltransferase
MSSFERLWSPWRSRYVTQAHGDVGGCIFCELPPQGNDEETFVLTRERSVFAMLNAFPYNPGHLMVVPFRHVGELEELTEEELVDSGSLLQQVVRVLRDEMDPDGFNIGMNLGKVAGAGVPDHVHWHVVPRWNGDTNYMPVIGQTRVLPESLEDTYRKLKKHLG